MTQYISWSLKPLETKDLWKITQGTIPPYRCTWVGRKKNHNKGGWDSYLAKLRCRPLWIQIYCSQGHISSPHAWSFYPLRPVSHIISKKHLSGCIPRSISLLQEDISLGRLQTLLVICASTDWLMCLFAVLFALSQPSRCCQQRTRVETVARKLKLSH